MERSVLQGRVVRKEDLAPHRPGGVSNPDKTVRGWLRYFAVLHRKHATLMEGPLSTDADATLVAALRAEPVRVLLVGDPETSSNRVFAVHPKSFETLLEMQKHDDLIGWLAARYLYIQEHQQDQTDVEFLAFSQRALDELTYQYQLLAWIALTPGPGMPFDPLGTIPAIPSDVRGLDVLDYIAIVRAHVQANAIRLQSLRSMLTPETGAGTDRQRPTWAMFFASAAMDLKTSPRALMRDHSLIEVLAMLQLNSVATRDAQDDAKRHAEAAA